MRFTTRFRSRPALPACCRTGEQHCHGTLVLHADGTAECDEHEVCGLDELLHELWMGCQELGCSCAGDDAPLDAWALPLAA